MGTSAGVRPSHLGLAEWSLRAAEIVDAIDDQGRLPSLLAQLVAALAENSVASIGGFGRTKKLTLPEADRSDEETRLREDGTWEAGGYLLDPYYARYRAEESGCFPLRDVAPKGFEKTEFFRRYYLSDGFCDNIAHMSVVSPRAAVVVSVARKQSDGKFSDEEIARHHAAHPFIAACSQRCSDLILHSDGKARADLPRLDDAVEQFGADLLTPRESETIGLVLYGHNTQSVSVQLGITADTVKLHRKHAYAKLRVSSQGELFFKFLEHLGLETSE